MSRLNSIYSFGVHWAVNIASGEPEKHIQTAHVSRSLRDIPVAEPKRTIDQGLSYEPINDIERKLLSIVEDHQNGAVQRFKSGTFDLTRTMTTPGQTLIVYRETLGRVLGKPLEGGVKVGIHTGIKFPNEFDGSYNVLAVINADGRLDRYVSEFGCIFRDLLSDREKQFLDEHYFPVEKIPEMMKPYLR